jgi:predicted DsbA family dithiol-disulfide isomerase
MSFRIDVTSDVVCPWCYVGKRELDRALARLRQEEPDAEVEVRWHPFELAPGLPAGGVDRKRYLADKFRDPVRLREAHARLEAIGAQVGIRFAFDRIAVEPNTLAAHRLIAFAQQQGVASDVVEQLFAAFFVEGRDIGDRGVLLAIAAAAGLDRAAVEAWLDAADGRADVDAIARHLRELGVAGVPFFVFGGRLAMSGAQNSTEMLRVIREARDAWITPPATGA